MRPEKQLLLDDIKSKIDANNAFLVTQYVGFVSQAITEFRNKLYEVGADFEVVPKRVFAKAAKENGVELDPNALEGHIGIVFTPKDVVETAKVVVEFGKSNNDAISILCGQLDGVLYDAEKVIKISQLPSLDALRSEFLGLLEAPMTQLLGTFESLLTSIIFCLDNKAKKDQE